MFLLKKALIGSCSKCRSPTLNVYRNKKRLVSRPPRWQINTDDTSPSGCLKVIGSGAPDQPASVVVYAKNKGYLFNCGEGIIRQCQDAQITMKNIDHVFLTQSKWNCIGGLVNVVTEKMYQSGYPPTIHGSKDLPEIVQRITNFSLKGVFESRLNPKPFSSSKRFEDDAINIRSVKLKCLNDRAYVYVCMLKASKGKLSLKKSVEKNVPAALLEQLSRGENAILDDGTLISCDEVRDRDMPDTYVIVVDVPNEGFLKDLKNNKKLKQLLDGIGAAGVKLIVHFTPSIVFNTSSYQHFVESIDPEHNLIVNDLNKFCSMKRIHLLQMKLNKIDPIVHPMLSMKVDTNPKMHDPTTQYGKAPMLYTKYMLQRLIKDELCDEPDPELDLTKINEALDINDQDSIDLFNQTTPVKLKDETFPRILFLGTGASCSFHLRNTSAILVHVSKDHSILLDCGGATCAQINRFYGDEAPEIYRRLKAVYVSHMHQDHYFGLPELFRRRQMHLPLNREPLRVFCPLVDLKSWLLFYADRVDPIHTDIKFIDNQILVEDKLYKSERSYLNIESITTCPVEHFRMSYALALTIPYYNGNKKELFKVAYSGDTGLSDAFIEIGQNSDVLIHEATFQNELKHVARSSNHSTIAMALLQGQRMRAKHTILTHFSTKYNIIPYIEGALSENTGIAFDYMEVTPSDLPRLGSLYADYRNTFPDIEKSLERKARTYKIKSVY